MTEKEFINKWIEKIENELLKKFPDDFIYGFKTELLDLPGKPLTIGSELFGQYEVIDIEGNPFIQTDDYNFVKYILYSNREKPISIKKPQSNTDLTTAIKRYENLLDSIIKEMKKDHQNKFKPERFLKVSNSVFTTLNLRRY